MPNPNPVVIKREFYTSKGSRVREHAAEREYTCEGCGFQILKDEIFFEVNKRLGFRTTEKKRPVFKTVRFHKSCWRPILVRLI